MRRTMVLSLLALAGLAATADARFGDRLRAKREARRGAAGACSPSTAVPQPTASACATGLSIWTAPAQAAGAGDCSTGACSPGANGVRGRFFGR